MYSWAFTGCNLDYICTNLRCYRSGYTCIASAILDSPPLSNVDNVINQLTGPGIGWPWIYLKRGIYLLISAGVRFYLKPESSRRLNALWPLGRIRLLAHYTISLPSLCRVFWRHLPYKMFVMYILYSVPWRWGLFAPLSSTQYIVVICYPITHFFFLRITNIDTSYYYDSNSIWIYKHIYI